MCSTSPRRPSLPAVTNLHPPSPSCPAPALGAPLPHIPHRNTLRNAVNHPSPPHFTTGPNPQPLCAATLPDKPHCPSPIPHLKPPSALLQCFHLTPQTHLPPIPPSALLQCCHLTPQTRPIPPSALRQCCHLTPQTHLPPIPPSALLQCCHLTPQTRPIPPSALLQCCHLTPLPPSPPVPARSNAESCPRPRSRAPAPRQPGRAYLGILGFRV